MSHIFCHVKVLTFGFAFHTHIIWHGGHYHIRWISIRTYHRILSSLDWEICTLFTRTHTANWCEDGLKEICGEHTRMYSYHSSDFSNMEINMCIILEQMSRFVVHTHTLASMNGSHLLFKIYRTTFFSSIQFLIVSNVLLVNTVWKAFFKTKKKNGSSKKCCKFEHI